MRSARLCLVLSVLLLNVPGWAQQAQTNTTPPADQTTTALTPAPKDPQAVGILNQALAVAGGAAAINTIADYTATGNIIYHWNPEAQGSVTVRGLGSDHIRVDANLPRGMHSSVISAGQTSTKAEDGRLTQYPPPYPVPSSDAFPFQPPMFPGSFALPQAQVVAALNSPRITISYKGIVQLDGNSVHDVQVEQVLPGQTHPDSMAEYHTIDFFIDTSTLQLVMTQDNVPKHIIHQIRYSDYRPVNGVLVPFSISEKMGGQETRDIQLSQVSFNGSLQDSDFTLQ